MFSYPSGVFPLLLLYAVCLGGIGGKPALRLKIPRWTLIAGVALSAAAAWQSAQAARYIRHLSDTLSTLHHNPADSGSIDIVEHSYTRMRRNTTFCDYYMMWLNSRPDLLARSENIKDVLPSCEGYCMLGKYYSANNSSKHAEHAFSTASNMVPTRVRPKCYLWELYVAQGDTAAAIDIAQKILRSPVKAESVYTLRVKGDMRQFLKNAAPNYR
ncbi:MAG: hypothetical protein LBL94_12285 [Prevotellaceae bacterium]|jgi:hypothetical protein|nr:hypothetical protein [Prevotellaceae bacterium]